MKRHGERIWRAAFELTPAAIFGGAVALSSALAIGSAFVAVVPIASGAAACAFAFLILRRLGDESGCLNLPQFTPCEFEPESAPQHGETAPESVHLAEEVQAEPLELLLEDELTGIRLRQEQRELVLNDVLEAVESDSAVVRLFERPGTPTAGELQERIERHLRNAPRPAPDATQELHEALAALRQSLR